MDKFWFGYMMLMLGLFIGFALMESEGVEQKSLPVGEIKEGFTMAFETLLTNEGFAIFMITMVALTAFPMMVKLFRNM